MKYICSFDFVTLTETFIEDSSDLCKHFFPDYKTFPVPAIKLSNHGRRSGGLLVMVNSSFINYIEQVHVVCSNVIVLKISGELFHTNEDCLYISVYVPPSGSPFYANLGYDCLIDELEACLCDLLGRFESINIICTGDFNARTSNLQVKDICSYDNSVEWEKGEDCELWNKSRTSQDEELNDFGKRLLQLCTLFDCKILNGCSPWDQQGKFTFMADQGCSTVDYFLVSYEISRIIEHFTVADRIESDHMPIELSCSALSSEDSGSQSIPQIITEKIIWQPSKIQMFQQCIDSPQFHDDLAHACLTLDYSIEDSLDIFNGALLAAANCMLKVKSAPRQQRARSPWFDKECYTFKKIARGQLRTSRVTKSRDDFILFKQKRKEYRELLTKKEEEFNQMQENRLVDSLKCSSAFWSEIRKHQPKRHVNNKITKEEWVDHFDRVLNAGLENDSERGEVTTTSDLSSFDEELDAKISEKEIETALNSLKCGKASGPDGIIAELLKHTRQEIIPYLKKLFNALFSREIFPEQWTRSIIVPLHKKGDANCPNNYRGISLLNILSKVYTHILNKRLTVWAEKHGKLLEAQAGFRKGRSTIDHIFTLNAAVEKQFNTRSKLYVAFIDFHKAYDTVKRSILWSVLLRSGIQGRMFQNLKAIYSSVQSCVMCKGELTSYFRCIQGLKQGCILSPVLFSLLINELAVDILTRAKHGVSLGPSEIELSILLFADDLTLVASTVVGLQNQLNRLSEGCKQLGLTVNLDKSKILVFTKGGYLSSKEKWHLDNHKIEVVNNYKYLGLTFSTRKSFAAALEESSVKAKKKTIEILRTLRRIHCNSVEVFFKLFDSQVVPTLLYAAEIWGYEKYKQIERVHLFACKRFLHVPTKTVSDIVYGELGRYPLFITTTIKVIKYWFRLLKQADNMYSKKSYKMLLTLHEKGVVTWVSYVKSILCNNGFEQVWIFGCGSEKRFCIELRERLFSSFCYHWQNHLEESNQTSVYCQYKHIFVRETYITCLWKDVYRNALAQFRMGVSQLNVHKFRFRKTDDNIICPVCCEEPETETHFLFECKGYSELRSKFLACYMNSMNSNARLSKLFNEESTVHLVNISKFIVQAFNIRALVVKPQC